MASSTRSEAIATGDPRYFTGRPCKHGHIAERTQQGCCTVCLSGHRADWRAANRSRELSVNAEWRKNNRDRFREMVSDWNDRNPGARAAHCRERQARKRNATPKWLTREQRRHMKQFYILAAQANEPVHVDHIVPLDGRLVCGLHVPWNLQLLGAIPNMQKGSKL